MDLSVIIVNYNVRHFAEHCIYSVLKAAQNLTIEILLVDNASGDGSMVHLQRLFPQVRIIRNEQNRGFGAANNQALEAAKGDHILFLNPDTIIPEDCFEKCLAFMQEQKNCGALGVRMIDGSGNFLPESKRNLPTVRSSFSKLSGLDKIKNSTSGYYANHLAEYETGRVDVLAGAFMMLSRKAIELTKGFDENFFMYGEDIDLSYRIMRSGLLQYYYPEITIIHFKGESFAGKRVYNAQFYGAMKTFVDLHYSKKPFSKNVLKAGVAVGRLKNAISFKKKKQKWNNYSKPVFIGTQESLLNALKIEKLQPLQFESFILQSGEDEKFIVDSLHQKILESKNDACFICADILSNKSLIKIIDDSQNNCDFYISENHGRSFISSNNRSVKGMVIAAESLP